MHQRDNKSNVNQASSTTGMSTFVVVWLGQMVSTLGTAMAWFALTIWAWESTGEATSLALVSFFSFGTSLLLSPFAGALVDRWNRKYLMMFSDIAVGLATPVILYLYWVNNLEICYVYVLAVWAGVFGSLQYPAYSAAITMMLPKGQYARAEGMVGLSSAAAGIIAPALAAILYRSIGFDRILMLDLFTLLVALLTLFIVHIPQPDITQAGYESRGSIWQESVYGFRYIFKRPSLSALLTFFAVGNIFEAIGFTLIAPMILARSGNDEVILGSVQSAGAIGGAVGGFWLVVWGGPKRRIQGVLLGWALANLLGMSLMGLGHGLVIWVTANFFADFFTPIVDGSDQAIWQSKVAPDVQGRVFATRLLLSQMTIPPAMLLAGYLADSVFEPAMMPDGRLADGFGWLVGTGAGTGMSLLIVFAGVAGIVANLAGYAFRRLRDIEDILPDHDAQLAQAVS